MDQDLELNLKRTNETKSIETKIWESHFEWFGLWFRSQRLDHILLDPKGTKKSPYRILRIEASHQSSQGSQHSPMLREDDLNVFHDGCHMLFANERTAEDICNMSQQESSVGTSTQGSKEVTGG